MPQGWPADGQTAGLKPDGAGAGTALGMRQVPDGALQVAKTAKLMMPVTNPQNSHLCSPQPICQPLCPGVGGGAQSEKTPQGPGCSRKGPSLACLPFTRTPVLQHALPSGHCPARGGHLLGTHRSLEWGPDSQNLSSPPAPPHCQAPLPRPGHLRARPRVLLGCHGGERRLVQRGKLSPREVMCV